MIILRNNFRPVFFAKIMKLPLLRGSTLVKASQHKRSFCMPAERAMQSYKTEKTDPPLQG